MSRIILNLFVVLLAIAAGIYQFYVKDLLNIIGYNRSVESIGNKNCQKVPELKACEGKYILLLHDVSPLTRLASYTKRYGSSWTFGSYIFGMFRTSTPRTMASCCRSYEHSRRFQG
jgi:hypothetical protein